MAGALQLSSLLAPGIEAPPEAGGLAVHGLISDSRAVRPGVVFAALAGTRTDGARFVADAVGRGAVAVLAGRDADVGKPGIPVLRADDPRRALALMAARLHPRQPGSIVAVTGTQGKSSVVEFTRQIFAALGRPAASLGTIGVVTGRGAQYGALTTPDPVTLHATLDALAEEGVTHLAMEASSHGLDQRRLDGVRIAAAAFLNLGRDHLDYHPTVEAYLAAKLRLLDTLLEPGRPVVVCHDAPFGDRAMATVRTRGQRLITIGRRDCDLTLVSAERDGFAQRLEIAHAGRKFPVRLPLIGTYQGENALVAAALAIALGEDAAAAIEAIGTLSGVPGRLEIVGEGRGGLVVVDYAHKPDALSAALDALRPFVTGRLVSVFGCGGDRDRGKRPIMGRISAEKADVTIVTDDNPRSEVASAIRAEVLAGARDAGRGEVREIGDRASAIRTAIAGIGPGDVVVIAGKGHETGQIVGGRTIPFCDQEEARAALAEVGP